MKMTEINLNIDAELFNKASDYAKSIGISLNTIVRMTLVAIVSDDLAGFEKGLLDCLNGDYTNTAVDDFLNELDRDIASTNKGARLLQ